MISGDLNRSNGKSSLIKLKNSIDFKVYILNLLVFKNKKNTFNVNILTNKIKVFAILVDLLNKITNSILYEIFFT